MREAKQWMAWYLAEPRGEPRVDWMLAQLSAAIVNALGGKMEPHDFIPWGKKPQPKKQTIDEQKAAAKAWIKSMQGKPGK